MSWNLSSRPCWQNATRICEAKFGSVAARTRRIAHGRDAQCAAAHYANARARTFKPHANDLVRRAAERSRWSTLLMSRTQAYAIVIRGRRSVELGGARTLLGVRCSRRTSLSALSPSIARRCARSPTSRSSWSEFRGPGGHRDREHAAAERAARIAAATDRDRRGAAGHLKFARSTGARVPSDAGKRDAHLRGELRYSVSLDWRRLPHGCNAQRAPGVG